MAKCDICGKGVTFGIKVSHSHRRSNRAWKPNVKRVKAMDFNHAKENLSAAVEQVFRLIQSFE